MKYYVLWTALLLALAGCGEARRSEATAADGNVVQVSRRMYRVVDVEAGVVCWVVSDYQTGGGVSCLPLSETRLDK